MNRLLKQLNSRDEFNKLEYFELSSFHWESEHPYRPRTFAKTAVVVDTLTAELICCEDNPKTIYTERDEPIYRDSCLEFFFAPVPERSEYINIECNSAGAFLSEFGSSKESRRYIKELTPLSPRVTPINGTADSGDYWGITIEVSKELLSALYGIAAQSISFNSIRANFYKCDDDCKQPHYLAFSPVTTLPPGFHNPECFCEFKINSEV